ncbi:MAG: hypothetical protein LWX07_08470, partial [Bacteroidetes bacterium]|nr:hypothetical protein [Bacteroidota bacterium]
MRLFFAAFGLVVLLLISVETHSQSIYDSNPVNSTPAKERLGSFMDRKAAEDNSLVKNIPFRSIGPSVMSGRVVDID